MNNSLCKFCNSAPSDISSSVDVELIYYNFGLMGRYTHNFSKMFNGLPEITLGSKDLRVNIPRCKECLQKHKSASFFDFSTKKSAKLIVKEQIKLYIENGYKIEWIWLENSIFSDKDKYPTISFEKSIFYKDIISFISIMLKLYNLFDENSIKLLHKFFEKDLGIPEHELFIFINHLKKEINSNYTVSKNNLLLLVSKIGSNYQNKEVLINLLDFLVELFISNNNDLENRIKELLSLEKIFNVHSNELNYFR